MNLLTDLLIRMNKIVIDETDLFRLYSAAELSLLQTPPVTRRRTFFAADAAQVPKPPQSILSARHQRPYAETPKGPSDVAGVLTFDGLFGIFTSIISLSSVFHNA